MTRENLVRLSDREKELAEEVRETLYPHNSDDIPLGMAIGEVCEEFQKEEQHL